MLGPSGSGKTTCLRLIAGFEQPDEGHIEIFGETAEGVPPYKRNVNTVFQDYALFPHMTVGENVAYGLRIKGVPAGRARDQGERRARHGQARRIRGSPPGAALGRPAPARGARPRAGERAKGAAPRRAARRARSQAQGADAGRAEGPAERARHHLRVRDARPGRSTCRWPIASPCSTTARSSRSACPTMSMNGRGRASSPTSSARRTCLSPDFAVPPWRSGEVDEPQAGEDRRLPGGQHSGDAQAHADGEIKMISYQGAVTRFSVETGTRGSPPRCLPADHASRRATRCGSFGRNRRWSPWRRAREPGGDSRSSGDTEGETGSSTGSPTSSSRGPSS